MFSPLIAALSGDILDSMKNFPSILKGVRVQLRMMPATFENALILHEAVEESRDFLLPWLRWARPGPVEDMFYYLDGKEQDFALKKNVWYGIFEGERYLGHIGLHSVSDRHKSAKIGYWIRLSAKGKGYVSEALSLLEEAAFSGADGFNRLVIDPENENATSIAVAKRNGYAFEGILRQDWYNEITQKFADICVYSKLKEEWEK